MLAHAKQQNPLATNNPPSQQNLSLICSLTQTHPLLITHPIRINFILFLNGKFPDSRTCVTPQGNLVIARYLTTPLLRSHSQRKETLTLHLATAHMNPTQMLTYALIKEMLNSSRGPLKQSPTELNVFPCQPETPFLTQAHASFPSIITMPKHSSCCASPILSLDSNASEDSHLMDPTDIPPTTDVGSPSNVQHPVQGRRRKGKKLQKMPTRRSLRIQEKQKTNSALQANLDKGKSKILQLPFDLDSNQTTLDTSKALAILQATGMEISERLEEVIDEALKKDQIYENNNQSMPTTPLHDP